MSLDSRTTRRIVSASAFAALIFTSVGATLPTIGSAVTSASVTADRKPTNPSSNSNANSNANSNSNGNGNSSAAPATDSVTTTDKKPDKGGSNGNSGNTGDPGNSGGNGNSAGNGNSSNPANGNNGSGASESAKPDKPSNGNSSNSSSNSNGSSSGASNGNSASGNTGSSNSANSSKPQNSKSASNSRVASQALQSVRITTAPEGGDEITACLSDLPKGLAKNVARKDVSKSKPAVPSSAKEEQDLNCEDTGVATAYIVQFTPGANRAAEITKVRQANMKVTHVFNNVLNGMTVWATPGQLVRLKNNPNFTLVEPDGAVASVESTQQPATWGLDRIDQRPLPLTSSYTYATDAAGVQAYVIDTGIRSDHTEFTGRIGSGYTSIIDGLGTSDCNGHGTHVAGTIGGTTYGVAKGVTLRPVRVLDCNGSGTWSGVIAGLDWVAGVHQSGSPAVANMSLGGGASSSVDTAVRNLISRGVNVVVAAGNSNTDACTSSPARVAEAITVGSTTSTDARSSFSNYGTCLDLFAPGSSITSAWNTSPTAAVTISGTSMASPHVAGAAALALAINPSLSTGSLASTLASNATPSVVTDAGAGSPNLLVFTQTTTTPEEPEPPQEPSGLVPDAPSAPNAAGGVRSATVTWSVPTSDGGNAITSYTVRAYELQKNGRTRLAGAVVSGPDQLTMTITGLKPNSRFQFTVAATNSVGTGAESTASNVVTVGR